MSVLLGELEKGSLCDSALERLWLKPRTREQCLFGLKPLVPENVDAFGSTKERKEDGAESTLSIAADSARGVCGVRCRNGLSGVDRPAGHGG